MVGGSFPEGREGVHRCCTILPAMWRWQAVWPSPFGRLLCWVRGGLEGRGLRWCCRHDPCSGRCPQSRWHHLMGMKMFLKLKSFVLTLCKTQEKEFFLGLGQSLGCLVLRRGLS